MNKFLIAMAFAGLAPLAANAASVPSLNTQSAYQATVQGFGSLHNESLSNTLQAPAFGAGQAG